MSYSKDAWTLSTVALENAMESLKSEVAWQKSQMETMQSMIDSLETSRDSWKKIAEDTIKDYSALADRLGGGRS